MVKIKIPEVGRSSFSVLNKLRFLFMIFIFGIMLINTVIIIYQNKNLEPGFKYIGGKWLNATGNLGDNSRKLIKQGGIYNKDNNFIINFWEVIKSLYNILEAMFIIYMWLKVLVFLIMHFVIWDSSKVSVSYIISIIFFILLQMLISKDIMQPIYDFRDFFKSIPYIFQPISNVAEKFK